MTSTSRGPLQKGHGDRSRRATSGFTLIEMLVVLVIVGLGASLVGPRLIENYRKVRGYAEEQKLFDVIDTARMHCFLRQVPNSIELDGNSLFLKNQKVRLVFDFLKFPKADIAINGNGFTATESIDYYLFGKEKVFYVLKE